MRGQRVVRRDRGERPGAEAQAVWGLQGVDRMSQLPGMDFWLCWLRGLGLVLNFVAFQFASLSDGHKVNSCPSGDGERQPWSVSTLSTFMSFLCPVPSMVPGT